MVKKSHTYILQFFSQFNVGYDNQPHVGMTKIPHDCGAKWIDNSYRAKQTLTSAL